MRLALTAGAAFVCGEMGHRRDPCSSHTLQRSESNMDAFDDPIQARAPTHMHRYIHTYNKTQSRVNMLQGQHAG